MGDLIVRAIIEMLGGPKEHIEKTLQGYIAKLKADGLKIRKEEYAEPKENGKMWTVFAEIELEFQKLQDIVEFGITSLPASIEIVSPDFLTTPVSDMNSLLNDIQGHLHDVDMVIKDLRARTEIIDKNAVALLRNFIVHILENKQMGVDQLSGILGIKPGDLQPFLDRMVEMNLVLPEREEYHAVKKS